jgi:hypothetical protein
MNVTGRNRFLKFTLKFEILLKALKTQEKLNVLKWKMPVLERK